MLTDRDLQIVDLAVLTAIDKVKSDEGLLIEWLSALQVKKLKIKTSGNPGDLKDKNNH